MMTCINVAEFVLISYLEKDHSVIETRGLKNIVIFIQINNWIRQLTISIAQVYVRFSVFEINR